MVWDKSKAYVVTGSFLLISLAFMFGVPDASDFGATGNPVARKSFIPDYKGFSTLQLFVNL